MATKSLRGVPQADSVGYNHGQSVMVYFVVGDTAYFNYNSSYPALPVIVVGEQWVSPTTKDGDQVLYTVAGDIASGLVYPSGAPTGPITGVPASALSTR